MAVAITEECLAGRWNLPTIWHRAAPRRVTKQYCDGDFAGGWTAWRNHLRRRKSPEVTPFLVGVPRPLLWYWPNATEAREIEIAVERPVHIACELLRERPPREPSLLDAGRVLALAYSLPDLVEKIPADSWWQLATWLHDWASEAQHHHVDWPSDPYDVLKQQLLAGELPLALGYLFPEVKTLRTLRKRGHAALSEALVELTDGEGMPHARLLDVLGPLFACWTRSRWLGEHSGRGPWSRAAEVQYRWLLRHAIRLADAKGRLVLSPSNDNIANRSTSLFTMALDLAGDERDCAATTATFSRHVVPKQIQFDADRLPKTSVDSEWSGISVLSTGWSQSAIRLAMTYADEPMQIELTVEGERLLFGPWHSKTTCEGKPIRAVGEWENVCWQSDKLCDVLELCVQLSDGLRLERQIVLGRQDRVLYLADMVIAADGAPRQLRHSVSFPLDRSSQWQPEGETRDGVICNGKMRAAVLPLALPEWCSDPRSGTLVEEFGRLVLTHEFAGRALCCPLFFDLDPRRTKKDRTWRQLTVAEWMEIVSRDVAVGFRVQSGHDQWLYYRSLAPAGNRTVLGQNIAGEFTAGRFRSNGKYDEWIEIEAV